MAQSHIRALVAQPGSPVLAQDRLTSRLGNASARIVQSKFATDATVLACYRLIA